jgi:hypothetical protein
MPANNFEHLVGKPHRLKSHIKTRPRYFNDKGHMDYLITEHTIFNPIEVVHTTIGWVVIVRDKRGPFVENWSIKIEDIEPFEIDNRRVEYV